MNFHILKKQLNNPSVIRTPYILEYFVALQSSTVCYSGNDVFKIHTLTRTALYYPIWLMDRMRASAV